MTSDTNTPTTLGATRTIISVDAMGGDLGPAAVVAGISRSAHLNPEIGFIVSGDKPTLESLLTKKSGLAERCEIRHAEEVVTMDAKPSHVMRYGKETSMWAAVDAVKSGDASVCVSCGNSLSGFGREHHRSLATFYLRQQWSNRGQLAI